MNKSSGSPIWTKVYIALFVFVLIVVGLSVWKLQDKLDLKTTKINLTNVIPRRDSNQSKSIYDAYESTSSVGGSGVYYTTLKNVVCDAARDPNGRQRYFRISVTFESPDKKNATRLSDSRKILVEELRDTVSVLEVGSANQAQIMSVIKKDLSEKLKQKFGDGAVSDIYFEEILSQ